MRKYKIRDNTPQRTCTKSYSSYRSYKPYLKKDFNKSCGYCGDFEGWAGGSKVYHIDHFVPKSLFPHLKNVYNNLVYACPYCNISKSDDWPSGEEKIFIKGNAGYIEPCDVSYETHFSRDSTGSITAESEIALYMHKKLKFFLKRHRVIWNLTRLKETITEIQKVLDKEELQIPEAEVSQLKALHFELTNEFFKYLDYLMD
ncbi:hypothetical protein ASG66_17070 [Bacillus sp. Leaf406]|nr:hypothetical protein ASG66_17070 [Bacillus sp. Leaf406]